MFGFIYKNPTSNLSLVYDGNQNTLRYVVNKTEAERWYSEVKSFKKHTMVVNQKTVNSNIPVFTRGKIITKQFNKFLSDNKNIGATIKLLWTRFLQDFDVVRNGDVTGFKPKKNIFKKGTAEGVDNTLLKMKEFIFGFHRFEHIHMIKMEGENKKVYEIPTYQTIKNVEYQDSEGTSKTNILGVYAPQFREMMLGDGNGFENGRLLQIRQQDFLYLMGEQTYLAAARGLGKTLLLSLISNIFLVRTIAEQRFRFDKTEINFYGLTHDANMQIVQKILNLNKKMRQGDVFKYVSSDKVIYFMDKGEIAGRIVFFSAEQKEPGRGNRPSLIIFDEAAYMPEKCWNIISGQYDVPKIFISTIDPDSPKNEFYDGLVEAELRQNTYTQSNEELITSIRKKYGFDKWKSLDDVVLDDIEDARSEYFKHRPVVGLRYTIDDAEYLTKEQRKRAVEHAAKRGQKYMLAELFCEFVDESSVFDYEPCIISPEDIPKRFTQIVISFDPADQFDNPAVVICGLKESKVYVIESQILPREESLQIQGLKDLIQEYRTKYQTKPHVLIDCTQAPTQQRRYYEDRNIFIDMPIRISPGTDSKVDKEGFRIVGKSLLVKISQEYFSRKSVRINSNLTGDKSLCDELALFQGNKSNKSNKIIYKASKGKDDQVMALLQALFYLYEEGLATEFADTDVHVTNKNRMSIEEFHTRRTKKQYKEDLGKELDQASYELFGRHGY